MIGKGGDTIRGMEAEFECTIDAAEDGLIKVFATDGRCWGTSAWNGSLC